MRSSVDKIAQRGLAFLLLRCLVQSAGCANMALAVRVVAATSFRGGTKPPMIAGAAPLLGSHHRGRSLAPPCATSCGRATIGRRSCGQAGDISALEKTAAAIGYCLHPRAIIAGCGAGSPPAGATCPRTGPRQRACLAASSGAATEKMPSQGPGWQGAARSWVEGVL